MCEECEALRKRVDKLEKEILEIGQLQGLDIANMEKLMSQMGIKIKEEIDETG